jgi:hypothetical protein
MTDLNPIDRAALDLAIATPARECDRVEAERAKIQTAK